MHDVKLAHRVSLSVGLTLALAGCSAETATEESESSSDEIQAAAPAEVVTAASDTWLKTSTQDSTKLAESAKCLVRKGAKVTLRNVSVLGGHARATIGSAIEGCRGKPAFTEGKEVYAFVDHFSGWAPIIAPPSSSTGPSCSPARAQGVVAALPKALLDTIAVAEGTRGRGEDGYNVIFTYRYFTNCDQHPRQLQCSGSLCSDASGRYQFLSTTWAGLGLATFNPENQERGAVKLVARRGVTLPAGRPLSAVEFNTAMDRLSYEWASLPPGRYGQPNYSYASIRKTYCGFAGC